MTVSFVVTGGGRGIGRAIAVRLVAEGAAVVIVDLVAWLLGPTSGYVSGAVLPVDGGRAAKGRDPEEG